MADFQRNIARFEAVGAEVVAASVDSWDTARRAVASHLLTFPVLYGLDPHETAASLGSYLNEKADVPHLHATAFVLRPNGTIALALYSSGALGRLGVDDALTWWRACAGRPSDSVNAVAERCPLSSAEGQNVGPESKGSAAKPRPLFRTTR